MKKNLSTVNADLSSLAETMPTQRSPKEMKATKKTKPELPPEAIAQFTLKMRESLHSELKKLAVNNDMTMRGFIMDALKSKGLKATNVDLVDRRRRD